MRQARNAEHGARDTKGETQNTEHETLNTKHKSQNTKFMSDIIHLLPDSVANQIAAGEVIQRPASVLKELVENAIDAGATSIQIQIKDAGRTLIQVKDNGKGMSDTDARMAFERHATSKIKEAVDLFSLSTMGFRGEALASIAAVAQVELRSRREEDELGVMVEVAGTRVFKQEVIQCDKGTTFLVKNLFFNVPARRRFLKSDNVEKNHLLSEFYRIVLVNSEVEFAFFDGDDELYHLQASLAKMRIDNVFGKGQKKKIQQQLLSVQSQSGLVSIHGFVGRPEFAQKSALQYFFVNGRYMRHPYFHKAVMLAYHQMIQPNENPSYFIYFEVDSDTIDINIHPTKTEIKFENERAIWSILSATVKEALGKFNVVPSIDFDQEGAIDIPRPASLGNVHPPKTDFNPSYNPFNSTSYKRPPMDWDKLYTGFESDAQSDDTAPVANSAPIATKPNDIARVDIAESAFKDPVQQSLDIEGLRSSNYQFKQRFIVTSVKSGMLFIDQHRAHVRILYEEFMLVMKQQHVSSQQVLFPEVIDFDQAEVLWFEEIKSDLESAGFVFESAGDHSFSILGVPPQFNSQSVLTLLRNLVGNAQNTEVAAQTGLQETIALSLAEASALKAGQSLTGTEMSDLIDRLFACSETNYTPDAKLIMTIIAQDEINNRFK